ncbi:O-antigen ligase [Rhizobium sp. B21/90]|uniref:O-antigen ligase family protein n=1 Tax=Rhizobium sp. B21/90 TaxID=2819993 RepID=UPI001C5AD92C|nr:O-antigen ligase family protein [Rhizobium sp. B21/90]QYA03913.1 O-antigen ligase family protein [Rhizobium sp. B21/90]
MNRILTRSTQTTSFEKFLFVLSVLFFSYVMLGGMPFESRGDASVATVADFQEGNAFRQFFYLTFFVVTTVLAIRSRGLDYFKLYSPMFIVLFAYSALSISWAVRPDIGGRKLVLAIIFIIIVVNWFALLGSKAVLKNLTFSLGLLIVLSVIAVFVVPAWAKHPPGETDPALVGMWRGLFTHKNHAAAACAIALILFGYRWALRKQWSDFIVFFLSVVFLLGSGGKTALGFSFPSLIAALVFRNYAKKESVSKLAIAIVAVLFLIVPILGMLFSDKIIQIFSDPMAFTGRIQIWTLTLEYINDHPWFGSGYGSFWQLGDSSLLDTYSAEPWLAGTFHAHNGYIELALMLGIPGAVLALIPTVAIPLVQVFRKARYNANLCGLMFGWLLFSVLFNLLEAQIFTKDWEVWLIQVVLCINLRVIPRVYVPNVKSLVSRKIGEERNRPIAAE